MISFLFIIHYFTSFKIKASNSLRNILLITKAYLMARKLQKYIFHTKKKFIYFFLKKNIYIFFENNYIKKMVSKYLDMNFKRK